MFGLYIFSVAVWIKPAEMNHSLGASHTRTEEPRPKEKGERERERKDRWCLIVPLSATRQTESELGSSGHGYFGWATSVFFFF